MILRCKCRPSGLHVLLVPLVFLCGVVFLKADIGLIYSFVRVHFFNSAWWKVTEAPKNAQVVVDWVGLEMGLRT